MIDKPQSIRSLGVCVCVCAIAADWQGVSDCPPFYEVNIIMTWSGQIKGQSAGGGMDVQRCNWYVDSPFSSKTPWPQQNVWFPP